MIPLRACSHRLLLAWLGLVLIALPAIAQTAFLDFNTTGQYTNNFTPWNDNGGGNGGAYGFAENPSAGVTGRGGVSILNNNDTTAAYRSKSWNFATNGSTIIVSVLVFANGQTSGDKVQLGIMNSNSNGLNSNAGIAFDCFRFIPASAISWLHFEQYRNN